MLKDFKIERSDRSERKKGGCCIYTHKSLETQVLARNSNEYVELLVLMVPKLNLLITVVYRPLLTPSDKFKETIEKIRHIF